MSNQNRKQPAQSFPQMQQDLLTKAEQELAQGYLEVEITGLTLRRLLAAYTVLLRGAWSYTLGSVRSLLRPTPAV